MLSALFKDRYKMLSDKDIRSLVESGVIRHADASTIDGVTIDVHLGDSFLVERRPKNLCDRLVDVFNNDGPSFERVKADKDGFTLHENGFCQAMTAEYFNMPNDVTGLFLMKSKNARSGLDHSNAIILKPGWSGKLVLELRNNLRYHDLYLTPGQACGQVMFFRHAPVNKYAGQFNRQQDFQTVVK